MAAGKTRNDERNEIIQSQLEHLNSVVAEVKGTVVKLSELVTALQVQVAVLQFQARRTGATWGAVVGAVISAIVSAIFAILLKK